MNSSCSITADRAVAAGPLGSVMDIMRRHPGMAGLTAREKQQALASLGDISLRIRRIKESGATIDVSLNPELEKFMAANGVA